MLDSLKHFIIRNYVPWHNAKLARKNKKDPVPLEFWLGQKARLRRYAHKKDILTPSVRALRSKGEALPLNRLRDLFVDTELGVWALDKDTIALLWNKLQSSKPECIIECGSGVSTMMFARYFQDFCPQGKLVSLEQDEKEKQRVEGWLEKYGLSSWVQIVYSPLNEKGEYRVDFELVDKLLGGQKADWLMIDGPNGTDGSRAADMDGLLPYLHPGTHWYADDAFRDGELAFLEQWQKRNDISVEGIYPIGKGLATGTIK